MLSDDQLKEIQTHWREHGPLEAHYPGCYKHHMGCAIDALIHDLRYWRECALPRLEGRQVEPHREDGREKELLAVCENLLDLLRITFSTSSEAYLKGVDLVRVAQGLPPEGDPDSTAGKARRAKTPKAPTRKADARYDWPKLDGKDEPPLLP